MAALHRGSPASRCRMIRSPEPVGSRTGMQQDTWGAACPTGMLWGPPSTGCYHSQHWHTLCPRCTPALTSPWHPDRRYLLSGAKLCSTMQKRRSCLPLLRTQLKSCSLRSQCFPSTGVLLSIAGSGSDLLGNLLPGTKHPHDSVSLLNRSTNLLALTAGRLNDSI